MNNAGARLVIREQFINRVRQEWRPYVARIIETNRYSNIQMGMSVLSLRTIDGSNIGSNSRNSRVDSPFSSFNSSDR